MKQGKESGILLRGRNKIDTKIEKEFGKSLESVQGGSITNYVSTDQIFA